MFVSVRSHFISLVCTSSSLQTACSSIVEHQLNIRQWSGVSVQVSSQVEAEHQAEEPDVNLPTEASSPPPPPPAAPIKPVLLRRYMPQEASLMWLNVERTLLRTHTCGHWYPDYQRL
ncbi:hypothetical protein GDO81_012010 [Engystomops pustulosus]|uniref:Uncharacterized protein n=1 Tax=Engystomops pustulosus TaxID=76066 RepID=A0AAV7BIE8_ENGPU|nr:hypothetical protein GDO81_012010 [Engystomops pustulosus]